jgi:hypothetical protein
LDPFIFKGPLRDKRGNTPRNWWLCSQSPAEFLM